MVDREISSRCIYTEEKEPGLDVYKRKVKEEEREKKSGESVVE